MEAFIEDITRKLEEKLKLVPQDTIIRQEELRIQILKETLSEVDSHLSQYSFPDPAGEIHFYKDLLPPIYSKLLYYERVLEFEINCPVGKESQKHFYEEELQDIDHYLERKRYCVVYYRSGTTYLDDIYFLSKSQSSQRRITDIYYSAIGSLLFSRFICSEMLIKELERRLSSLNEKEVTHEDTQDKTAKQLKWKGPLVGLVELGYACKEAGVFDAPLHEIFECFEAFFSVQLKNTSRTFQEILSRKKEEAFYLDKLTEKFKEKRDRMNTNYKPRK